MEEPRIFVEYRDNKNSSGRVVNGDIHLKISSRLSWKEQQKHIEKLKNKLLNKMNWAQQYQFDNFNGIVNKNEELRHLAETINRSYYNFPLAKIAFHKQNSTWGTCSLKTRQLYVSHRLIGAPVELLWYVITHELCHLAEPSHNKEFWNLVGIACPNYRECRKKLKAYGITRS